MSKDKYDRQTRLWGEGQILICTAKILCLNSDACACETLKNLILSGVGEVTIVDNKKVTKKDLESNFFLDNEDLDKFRGEIVLKNLLELNPDVKGNFINTDTKTYIKDEKTDFTSFDIILSSNLYEEENNQLYEIVKNKNLRLVIIKNNGLLNYIRLYENFHANMNLRLTETPVTDYRLSCPWEELIQFGESFDLEKMDIIDHKNVPYFAILLKALSIYRKNKNNSDANPKTKEEKKEFEDIVKSFLIPNDNDNNENIQEAIKKTYFCSEFQKKLENEKVENIFNVLKNENLKNLLTKSNNIMKIFFIYYVALQKYIEKNKTFPVCGNIPDMISNTKNFIALKKIYNEKAKKDHDEMRALINDEIKESGDLTEEEKSQLDKLINNLNENQVDFVDILNKNWPQVSLFCYPDNKKEEKGEDFDIDQIDEDFKKLNFVWYLLFRASDKFRNEKNRYPGEITDFKSDVSELLKLAKNEFSKLKNKPDGVEELLNENNAFEFCRMGGGFVPPVISITGSIASQEIIKLITYQFETVNNTIIYDGINVCLSNIKI